MKIDRCVCFDRIFRDLQRIAATKHCNTIKELQEHAEFGKECRLCHPYIRRMLRTGETVFGQVITDADEPEPRII